MGPCLSSNRRSAASAQGSDRTPYSRPTTTPTPRPTQVGSPATPTPPSQTEQGELPTKPRMSTRSSLQRQAGLSTTRSSTGMHPGPSSAQLSRQNEASTPARPNVFISCAGEDKSTIALPLREKLKNHGITAFVDVAGDDLSAGIEAENAIISAMESAQIAFIVLSPEFIARKRPMKELMWFLRRCEETAQDLERSPVIIPFFYRLSVSELNGEPRFDRVDKNGQNLYQASRFFERMEAGEPEANIDNIRAALQKVFRIMGVRNDVDASNDISYIMIRRRGILLQKLCDIILQPMSKYFQMHPRAASKNLMFTREVDVFHAYFDALDTSDIVLDFDSRDEFGNATTQEGRILHAVMDNSQPAQRVISILGIHGVGKTSILRGISGLHAVKERFIDGVYHLTFGAEGTTRHLIRQLSKAVQRSGGRDMAKDMLVETDIATVINSFLSWFTEKICLFTVDDVWVSKTIRGSVISQLMHQTGRESKVLLTTRSAEIASHADTVFSLRPRGTLESESILLQFAGIEPEGEEGEQAVQEILKRCSGLPLFLSIAGRAVKSLSLRGPSGYGIRPYQIYAHILTKDMQRLLLSDFSFYGSLQAQLMTSIDLVEERKENFSFQVRHSMAEMHRRLSALKKQSRAPMRMLQFLWELENELQAVAVTFEFEEAGLAGVEFQEQETGFVEFLLLHDSVHEFALIETRKHGEDTVGHEAVLSGYSRGLAINKGILEWWHKSLKADGYIHENLCWHLLRDARMWELVQLLQSPHWTERQLDVNGISSLEADFALGIEAVRDKLCNISHDERSEMEEVLRLILDAAVLAWPYVRKNFRELWFQLHGRLKLYGDTFKAIREYLIWIETDAETPLTLVENSFLGTAGGLNTRIIPVGAPIECMSVLHDGKRVACGCQDGRILVLQMNQSLVERSWKAHDEAVLAISPGIDGTRLVSSSRDNTAKVWELETGRCVTVFNEHTDSVNGVAVMRDGRSVISVSRDGTTNIWDIETGQIMSKLIQGTDDRIECLATLSDREEAFIEGCDNNLRIWNPMQGRQIGPPFDGHSSIVTSLAVTPDARHVVTGSRDQTARIWDIQSHQQVGSSLQGHAGPVTSVAVSRDGRRLVTGSEDTAIQVWDLESQTRVSHALKGHSDTVSGVSFLAGGDRVVSSSWDGTIRVWDLTRSRTEILASRHRGVVSSISFTPDGKFVVSGSYDKTLRIWDAISGQEVGDPMEGHSDFVTDVAVTPDGRCVISASCDKTVRMWDLESRNLLHTISGHTDLISSVAITPQGDRAVTGSRDKTIRVWNLTVMDGSHAVLEGHRAAVRAVFVSDDGLRIISVDDDDNIFVWELETMQLVKRFSKKDVSNLSRREILNLVGEATVFDDTQLSIPLGGRQILYGEGPETAVLATVETDVHSWALSPDKKTICVGLSDGQIGLMKLLR